MFAFFCMHVYVCVCICLCAFDNTYACTCVCLCMRSFLHVCTICTHVQTNTLKSIYIMYVYSFICSVLQCVAVCCIVFHCLAICCSVLQRAAVCWSVWHELLRIRIPVRRSMNVFVDRDLRSKLARLRIFHFRFVCVWYGCICLNAAHTQTRTYMKWKIRREARCNTLQQNEIQYNTLQHAATGNVPVCCSVLQSIVRVAVCCSVLQCVAVCCSVLQCVAVCFSVLQSIVCVAVCAEVGEKILPEEDTHTSSIGNAQSACCSVLQCVVVCCSVLQCVVVCCRVLQCVVVCCSVRWGVWEEEYSCKRYAHIIHRKCAKCMLQCVANCCCVLLCVAVCCCVLQCALRCVRGEANQKQV